MAAKTLKQIRSEITGIKAKALSVKGALRPLAELENSVRYSLAEMANSHDQLIDRIVCILAHGHPMASITDIPASQLPKHAYGAAIAAIGIENIVTQAMKKAAASDSGALRMSVDDRDEQLQVLEQQLYSLELEEENLLNGESRRPDANPAAVLQIPLDAAEKAGLIKIRGY